MPMRSAGLPKNASGEIAGRAPPLLERARISVIPEIVENLDKNILSLEGAIATLEVELAGICSEVQPSTNKDTDELGVIGSSNVALQLNSCCTNIRALQIRISSLVSRVEV